jgi:hypothetical protein
MNAPAKLLFLDFRHGGSVHTAAFTVASRERP